MHEISNTPPVVEISIFEKSRSVQCFALQKMAFLFLADRAIRPCRFDSFSMYIFLASSGSALGAVAACLYLTLCTSSVDKVIQEMTVEEKQVLYDAAMKEINELDYTDLDSLTEVVERTHNFLVRVNLRRVIVDHLEDNLKMKVY